MEENKATPEYFEWISEQLSPIGLLAPWADKVQGTLRLLKAEMSFLVAFCLCLKAWDYSIEKEQDMKRLTSIVTPLKVVWPKEHKALSILNRLAMQWPSPEDMSIDDFLSAESELEDRIQQTKQLIQPWCENLMHSSMQFKSSTISSYKIIWNLLEQLLMCMEYFSEYRVGNKNIRLKQQLDALREHMLFLKAKLEKVEDILTAKEFHQFLNFSCVFANKAACLTCLYWAKESYSDEENTTEMNVVLFNMLQRYIPPSAPDITTLFVGILKSDSLKVSDSLLPGEVTKVVKLFFGHLATILKDDDFQILLAQLVFLFTFLVNPSCENAEQDSIRSQVYALLSEDAYLHFPFDKMKDDFFDKELLLGDCIVKIDLVKSRIEQLDNNKFSDSWIRVELDNLGFIQISSHLSVLLEVVENAWWASSVMGQLQSFIMDLRLLKMSLLCFAAWEATDEEISVRLKSMITNLGSVWYYRNRRKRKERRLTIQCNFLKFLLNRLSHFFLFPPESTEPKGDNVRRLQDITYSRRMTDWYPLAQELEEKTSLSQRQIHEWLVHLFHQPLRCKPPTSYSILKLLESILDSLQDLVKLKLGEIVPYEKQIETLKVTLVFLKNLLRLSENCPYSKELGEFKLLVQVFANGAAFLTTHYWKAKANDENAYETADILFRMMNKIKPATADVARMYFGILEAIYLQRCDSLMFGETASKFADLLIEDSVTLTPWKHEFQILRDDIIFLLTFLNDPPSENAEEITCSRIDALFWEDVYCLLPFDDVGERDFIKKKVWLTDFMMKIGSINAIIIQTFGNFPDASQYNFPKVVSPMFLDSLIQSLQNLKERLISDLNYAPFARYKIIKFEEELIYLRPLFNSLFNLQSEVLDQTWFEVVDSLHRTEHVICLCISSCFIFDHPIWYHMAHLSVVFDELKGVKTKLERIIETTMHDARRLPRSTDLISTHSEQAKSSTMNEIVVGFDGEADTITENITHGSMSLDTVSIVGMGGLGKTTLAKKVYNSLKGNSSFVVFSYSYVSQDPNFRRILLDILGDVLGFSTFDGMTEDDLAHRLWQGLSGRKYLIVLDDIWSESAWYRVRSSFPDDKNGSRVVMTTRSLEVADKCKISCSPHQLRFLSDIESWELLQKKVFSDGISPLYLSEIGKLIAKNCKGLPLAIGVVAGLLFRKQKDMSWWSEVVERVISYVSEEGCSKILELSYKHMPANLKPCFVYLGAFPEDMPIEVKNVILLWIAEGFIQESKTKNILDVGKDYIRNLVDRSLIIVDATSSTGDIKEFRVHDLIRDLCQRKCRDGNFLQINHGIGIASNPSTKHYRISTDKQSDFTIAAAGSSLSNARSLLCFNDEMGDDDLELPFISKLRHARVLHLEYVQIEGDLKQFRSLVHLRHIRLNLLAETTDFFSSISNLWNISSIILVAPLVNIFVPDVFWTVKSLRHVKLEKCFLSFCFSDRSEQAAYSKLDKVLSFGKPCLSTGRDVRRLLQRLPAVRRLSCCLVDNNDKSVETFDFPGELESLTLDLESRKSKYLINFPSTLKKLTLIKCHLSSTAILALAELEFLQVLKLRRISFPEKRLETEDLVFQNLIFLELCNVKLVEWNASTETFPCIEQLVIRKIKLKELPSCFGEIATLKRIDATRSSPGVKDSALTIQEELRGLGTKVEVLYS